MNYRIHYSNELYHHGVKGMKWGVRKEYSPKGQDKASGSSSAEKKRRKLTNKQKKIIGIAAGTVALAATGYVLYKTGQFDKIAQIGKKAADSQFGGKSSASALSKLGKETEDVRANAAMIKSINSSNLGPGGENNCFHTSTSYILNSVFGQKTTAKPFSGIDEVSGLATGKAGRDWKLFNSIFDGIKTKDYIADGGRSTSLSNAVNDITRGTTGVIHFEGHFMNYEMSRRGRLTLIDSQRNGNQIIEVTGDMLKNIGEKYKVQRILDFSEASIRDGSRDVLKHIVNN